MTPLVTMQAPLIHALWQTDQLPSPHSVQSTTVPSIFSRIIQGEIPARFIWRDDVCVAFMDVRPLNRGHVLVVPRAEIDHWADLDAKTVRHLMTVAHRIALAQQSTLSASRVGLMIAGFEVPHTHIHLVPIDSMEHLDFAQAETNPDPEDLNAVAILLSSFLNSSTGGEDGPGSPA